MVAVAMLAGFVSGMIFYEVNIYDLVTSRKEGLQMARFGLRQMERDLRQIASPDSIFQASADSIRFVDVEHHSLTYRHTGGSIYRNADELIDRVTAFHFIYVDDQGDVLDFPIADLSRIRMISVELTTTVRSRPVSSRMTVTLRNY